MTNAELRARLSHNSHINQAKLVAALLPLSRAQFQLLGSVAMVYPHLVKAVLERMDPHWVGTIKATVEETPDIIEVSFYSRLGELLGAGNAANPYGQVKLWVAPRRNAPVGVLALNPMNGLIKSLTRHKLDRAHQVAVVYALASYLFDAYKMNLDQMLFSEDRRQVTLTGYKQTLRCSVMVDIGVLIDEHAAYLDEYQKID